MANAKEQVDNVLGIINSALTILDKFPKLDETDGNMEMGLTISPFALLAEILKNYGGMDYILKILSDFLVLGIVPLELAVKTMLMTTFKNLLTCSLNPIIPNELLKYGMVFDIREIDMFNMLATSPLTQDYGKYYYFGCTQAEIPDQLRQSQDFNAFLWFMINRSTNREIWMNCSSALDTTVGTVSFLHEVPLKDETCVDVEIKSSSNEDKSNVKEATEYSYVDARWKPNYMENGNVKDAYKKQYQNIQKLIDKNIIYYNISNNEYFFKIKKREKEQDGKTIFTFEPKVIQENEIIYDYKTDSDDSPKINGEKQRFIYYEKGEPIKLKQSTIEKRNINEKEKVRCGELEPNTDSNGITDEYKVTIDGTTYYRCNADGYIVDTDSNVYKKSSGELKYKTNLLTGKKQIIQEIVVEKYEKLKKGTGIITLEYHENSESVTDAEGNPLTNSHVPDRNCLHVFIGNTQPKNIGEIINIRKQIRQKENEIVIQQRVIVDNSSQKYKKENDLKDLEKKQKKDEKNNNNTDTDNNKNIEGQKTQLKNEIENYEKKIAEAESKISKTNQEINAYRNAIAACDKTYRNYKQNYYYKRTLIEFDLDYIWSLKLFDARVLTAQLLDITFNNITMNLGLSYERIFLQNEIKKIVKGIIETDDAEVNDCFFTFSNDDYNSLMVQSEKIHQGLYASHPNQEGIKINPTDMLNKLNNISPDATQEEQKEVIHGVLREIGGELTQQGEALETDKVGIQPPDMSALAADMIENLMTNLACSLAQAILSPKVYLLLAINMKIMGEQTNNFDIESIIAKMKKLIVDLVRMIRDQLLQFIVDKVMELLKDLATAVATKISIEQAMYYYNIIRRLIDCFKNRSNVVGFTVDMVDYADIYNQETPPPTTEC